MRVSRFTAVRWLQVPALAVIASAAFVVPIEAAALPAVCVTDSCADVPQGEEAARTGEPGVTTGNEGAPAEDESIDEGAIDGDIQSDDIPNEFVTEAEIHAGDPADEDSNPLMDE
ncbi:hypothetical protein AB0M22_13275 [Nocardia sp. NPDC051756]|uniref:hypothetical protein n=1 Tax=Nocardia sp. NPDC051756 TaxID=3154751 RepID=UPI0034397D29